MPGGEQDADAPRQGRSAGKAARFAKTGRAAYLLRSLFSADFDEANWTLGGAPLAQPRVQGKVIDSSLRFGSSYCVRQIRDSAHSAHAAKQSRSEFDPTAAAGFAPNCAKASGPVPASFRPLRLTLGVSEIWTESTADESEQSKKPRSPCAWRPFAGSDTKFCHSAARAN